MLHKFEQMLHKSHFLELQPHISSSEYKKNTRTLFQSPGIFKYKKLFFFRQQFEYHFC